MSDQLWVVRAGKGAKYVQKFLDDGFIAVGLEELAADDLSLIDEAVLKSRVSLDPPLR